MAARTLARSLSSLKTNKIAVRKTLRDSRCLQTSSSDCNTSVLTEEWRQKCLKEKIVSSPFPDTHIPEVPFPEFAFSQMERHRNKDMLINGITGERFTFHESLRLCHKVASALLKMGLKPGERVAFLGFNLPEYFLAWLATMAAGGVCTDINPNSIAREIRDQLDRTQSVILFTHSECVNAAREALAGSRHTRKVVVFGETEGFVPFSHLAQDDGSAFKGPYQVGDPRTFIGQMPCSSGTTGLPKLVLKSHYSYTAMALSCIYPETVQTKEGDVSLLVLPLYHIFPIFMLSADMVTGATNVLLPKFNPETYLNAIQQFRVTSKAIVPPLVLFMLQHELIKQYDLSSLKSIVSGAAPVAPDLLEQIHDKFNLNFIRQGYGMTEICPVSVGLTDGKYNKSSVGVPMNQTEVKIVDVETGVLCGPNQPGELLARGPATMNGYFENPEATAATLDSDGWIHTGDIALYSETCEIFVVDRMKDLIKYKGHQVAPAELEALLLTHPAVKDVAVIGVPDQRAGELTRAYVVLEDATKVDEATLISFVATQTSVEKHLHGGVTFLKEIPKSPAGKVLKKNIRAGLL